MLCGTYQHLVFPPTLQATGVIARVFFHMPFCRQFFGWLGNTWAARKDFRAVLRKV